MSQLEDDFDAWNESDILDDLLDAEIILKKMNKNEKKMSEIKKKKISKAKALEFPPTPAELKQLEEKIKDTLTSETIVVKEIKADQKPLKKTLELEVSKGIGGTMTLVPKIKDAKELILSMCEDIGLIPRRGDIMVYAKNGALNPYITKSGYAQLAANKKISTKPKIDKMKLNYPYFALVYCETTDQQGITHGDFGACDSGETGKGEKPFNQILGTATTRARNRALNIATRVHNPSFEELDERSEEFKGAIDITMLQDDTIKEGK